MPIPVKLDHINNSYEPIIKIEGAIILDKSPLTIFDKTVMINFTYSFVFLILCFLLILSFSKSDKKNTSNAKKNI